MTTNIIPIVFSTNEAYLPFCYLAVKSLIEHSNRSRQYDIRIFETGLTTNSKTLIESLSSDSVSIQCQNVKALIQSADLRGISFLSIETYFRLFIPLAIRGYDKIIYLDSDIIVNHDITELYDIDLDGHPAAFVRDVQVGILKKHNLQIGNLDYKKCFNAGVMVMDVPRFEEGHYREKSLKLLHEDYARKERLYVFADQDLLQNVLYDNVKFLDDRWNFQYQYNWRLQTLDDDYRAQYIRVGEAPYIIHYAGDRKPWTYPEIKGAEYFWNEASHSEIYLSLLQNLANENRFMFKRIKYGYRFPFEKVPGNSKIALYAAGEVGKAFFQVLDQSHYAQLILWADRDFQKINAENATKNELEKIDFEIVSPESLVKAVDSIDYVVVCIDNEDVAEKIIRTLKDSIPYEKIVWANYHRDYMVNSF